MDSSLAAAQFPLSAYNFDESDLDVGGGGGIVGGVGIDGIVHNNNISSAEQQITFEIPTNLADFERLSGGSFHNLTALLNGGAVGGVVNGAEFHLSSGILTNSNSDSSGNLLFSGGSGPTSVDYQIVLNYLWIAVVALLIVMSAIFVIFSCYFYRKFKEWKKCNKDIRSQIQNDLYMSHGATGVGAVLVGNGGSDGMGGYYHQVESPPCYTIATGLPTYDEALLHSQFMFVGPDDGCSVKKLNVHPTPPAAMAWHDSVGHHQRSSSALVMESNYMWEGSMVAAAVKNLECPCDGPAKYYSRPDGTTTSFIVFGGPLHENGVVQPSNGVKESDGSTSTTDTTASFALNGLKDDSDLTDVVVVTS